MKSERRAFTILFQDASHVLREWRRKKVFVLACYFSPHKERDWPIKSVQFTFKRKSNPQAFHDFVATCALTVRYI